MEVVVDHDVKAVADFMQKNIPVKKLRGVANRLAEIAGLLWGHFDTEDVEPMRLNNPSLGIDPKPCP
jgi:hypothetical protein